jgi:hypothetical protein
MLTVTAAHAGTNLDVAWKACIAAAYSVIDFGDFDQPDQPDLALAYRWDDQLDAQCHQIQAMKTSEAKTAKETERQFWQRKWDADRDAKIKAAIPLIQRALADPTGRGDE